MTCTKETFLNDVKDHIVEVLHADQLYRHIRFRKPGTMCMHFDLITWPGYLCYTGDMGTYVFRRLDDMLQFFRTKPYKDRDPLDCIDRRYWAEKLEGSDKADGHKEFDPAAFKREITVQRRKMFVEHGKNMSPSDRTDFWESLDDVKSAADDGEGATYPAVREWSFDYHNMRELRPSRIDLYLSTDGFPSCKTYTHRFLWCCYALAWGIKQYDDIPSP